MQKSKVLNMECLDFENEKNKLFLNSYILCQVVDCQKCRENDCEYDAPFLIYSTTNEVSQISIINLFGN